MVKSMVNSYLPEFSDFTRVFSPVKVLCNGPLFTINVSQIYGCFFPRGLVTSHFINLHVHVGTYIVTMVFQYLESTLHTLVVATSDKLSGCQEQPLLNGMHKISEPVYYCISCYFHEGFIFANFASQTLAKISTSIHVYL